MEFEIRKDRTFTLAEAIGRMAGAGAMKGASPTAGRRAAEALISDYVRRNLPDPSGVLATVLIRQTIHDELLLHHLDRPLVALAGIVSRILSSHETLCELVRETDAQWGMVMHERPYFDRPGNSPDPADPYTVDSVRAALQRLGASAAQGTP